MRRTRVTLLTTILVALFLVPGRADDEAPQPDTEIVAGLGLTEQEVIDSCIYILARYLVIR
jgi:hypothetical protein